MSLHLGPVKDNFREISHAIYRNNEKLSLVANFSGTRIYDSGCGWGKIWQWFYSIVECLAGRGIWLSKLKTAILNTHAQFQQKLPLISAHATQYARYLKKSCNGYAVNENDFFAARKAITEWNHATSRFIKIAANPKQVKLSQLFNLCFDHASAEVFSFPEYRALKRYQKIIDLEGFTNGPLPLGQLEKAFLGKMLNESDQSVLKKWVRKINLSSCTVRQLHAALRAIQEELTQPGEERPNLGKMELCLEEYGCTLFKQPDPRHLHWRNQIQPGVQIDSEFILGEQIGKKPVGFDEFKIYDVDNYEDLVLIIGHNEAVLEMRQIKHSRENYAIEPVQFLGLDTRGRWAVMEKLQPLNGQEWTSHTTLTRGDRQRSEKIVNLLKWLVEEEQTPQNFSPYTLMFDQNFQLKSLKPTLPGDFDYNALEDFAFQYASGNPIVFQHLMEASGLSRHQTAEFYYEVVEYALKGEAFDIDDLGGIYNVTDQKVIDRGLSLQTDILQIRRKCCLEILKNNPQEDPQKIQNQVNDLLFKCYKKTKAAGLLWPTLQSEVMSLV